MNCHLETVPQYSKHLMAVKKTRPPLPKEFPEYDTLVGLLTEEKSIYHLLREKIDRNLDECQYCKSCAMYSLFQSCELGHGV